MEYQTAAIPITFSVLKGHSHIASFFKWDFMAQPCSSRQDFNWYWTWHGQLQ